MSGASTAVAIRRPGVLAPSAINAVNDRLESASPPDIIAWATETFGRRLVLTASFADTLLIDLALKVDPDIEIVFLDTGFHFAETLDTVRKAMDRYSLNLTVLRPPAVAADVWADGVDACCAARKVTPLADHLVSHADAWLSGLRRVDNTARSGAPIVSLDRRGLVKINPIASWSDAQVASYAAANEILVNPLASQGYDSVGCWPCTEPAAGRDGRWLDSDKTECGLHL